MKRSKGKHTSETLGTEEVDVSTLCNLFAEAFARYTFEVLVLSRRHGVPLKEFDTSTMSPPQELLPPALANAPEAVREAYIRSQRPDSPTMSNKDAGHRIAANRMILAMREQGLKQKEVAERARLSPASLSRILKAPHRSRVSTLKRIADAMGVELADLLDD